MTFKISEISDSSYPQVESLLPGEITVSLSEHPVPLNLTRVGTDGVILDQKEIAKRKWVSENCNLFHVILVRNAGIGTAQQQGRVLQRHTVESRPFDKSLQADRLSAFKEALGNAMSALLLS